MESWFPPARVELFSLIPTAGHTGLAGFSCRFTYYKLPSCSSAASAHDRADLPWEVSGREPVVFWFLWMNACVHPDAATQDLVPTVNRGVAPLSSNSGAACLSPCSTGSGSCWGWMEHASQQNTFPALFYSE